MVSLPRYVSVVFFVIATDWLCSAGEPPQPVEKPAANANPDGVTILMTRQWSPDGRVPTGTIWRSFQTWQTDVARTEKGDLVLVDPMTPRAGRNAKGELIRYYCNKPSYDLPRNVASVEIYPAKQVHSSAYPPAGWQAPDFDDRDWTRDPYPQRELYCLASLRCLRGKFEVTDRAKVTELALTVGFRGGVVAYLNGKEVGRAGLPATGEIKPDTLAEDYPRDAYVDSDGLIIQLTDWHGTDADRRKLRPALDMERGLSRGGGVWRYLSADIAQAGFFTSKDPEVATKYKSRTRKLEVKIPAGSLRKGVNVLALEIHRAPAWEGMFTSPCYVEGRKSLLGCYWFDAWWDRCELEHVKLTAKAAEDSVAANVAPPKGVRIWNHAASVELDPSYYGDPNEPLQPVRLRGLKNGTYSGQIVVSSTDPIKGLNVQVSELNGPGGTIPATAIQVGYPRIEIGDNINEGNFRLSDNYLAYNSWPLYEPIETAAPTTVTKAGWGCARLFPPMQPVWLAVHAPRDAKAGRYRGTVSVSVEGQTPVTATLELEIIGDWVLPDARDFKTYVGFLECPDAVAKNYKVAMWSDEHWRLMDKVYEVLGQVGTKDLFVPLIAKTHLGNPNSMVHWVKQADGSYLADTSIAEKFMDMAIKHLGKIPGVCFYIATRAQYCHTSGYGDGDGKPNDQAICTELDPATKELKDFFPPKWGTPEALTFWKPVLDKLRDFLAARGMKDSMMFGYLGDGLGPVALGSATGVPNYFSDLLKIAPNTRWMVTTHISPYSWKAGKLRNGEFLGVHSWVGASINNARWMDENDNAMFKLQYGWRDRSLPFFTLAGTRSRSPTLENDHCVNVGRMRVAAEAVLLAQFGGCIYQGFGSWGANFWGGECRAYDPGFGDVGLGESSALWLVGRGATGPVPSCRSRMLQESLQEAESRIFVQNAVLDAKEKLGADLAGRCQDVCNERTCAFSYLATYRHNDCEGSMPRARLVPDMCVWEDGAVKLYRLADEVAKALK